MLFLQVLYNRSSEIEELKSIIENLRENQERLQKDKAQEIEQLHEVIEKLQRELPLGGPAAPQASDGRAASLQSELLGLPAEGAKACAELEGKLRAALEAKEALSRLLAEQERGHGQALEDLQQRLQAAEEVAVRQLAASGPGAALREAEVQALASQIREFEAALRAKEAKIAERELEINALHQQKSAHSAELEAILAAVARFRCALEQQLLAASGEPPELQRLRAQCVRLSCQLQALNQRFLRCQREPDERQANGAQVAGSSGGWASWGEEASCHEEVEQDVCGRWLAEAPHGHGGNPQVGSFFIRPQVVQPLCAESCVHVGSRGVSGDLGVHVGTWGVSGELGVQVEGQGVSGDLGVQVGSWHVSGSWGCRWGSGVCLGSWGCGRGAGVCLGSGGAGGELGGSCAVFRVCWGPSSRLAQLQHLLTCCAHRWSPAPCMCVILALSCGLSLGACWLVLRLQSSWDSEVASLHF